MALTLWAQVIGAIGYALVACGGVFRDRRLILLSELLGCAFVAWQWYLLDVPSLAITNLVFMYAILTGIFIDKIVYGRFVSLLSIPIMALCVVLYSQSDNIIFLSAVLIGSTLGLYARSLKNVTHLRAFGMCGSGFYCVINAVSGSVPGVLCSLGYWASHGWSLLKVYFDSNSDNKTIKELSTI